MVRLGGDLARAATALAVLALAACAEAPAKPGADGKLPEGAAPLHYRLALTIDPRQDTFTGTAAIRVKLDKATDRFWIHGEDFTVTQSGFETASGEKIAATYAENGEGFAEIALAKRAPAGEGVLTLAYTAPFAKDAAGLYLGESGGERYAMTQFQAIDARRAFPGFDEPRHKTPFDIEILAPEGYAAISNTATTSSEAAGAGFTRHLYATSQPLPTYLLAFVVGPYDVVDGPVIPATQARPALRVRGVAPRGKGPDIRFALDNTANLVAYFEDYFGVPYPYDKLDIIAAPEFAAGAMENAGAIIYAEQAILMKPGAPVSQQRNIINTHAHEIAHHWFGNLVTPAWWDDIWLNEAFATWMAYKSSAALFPTFGFERDTQLRALAAMADDSLSAARRIREPIVNESDIEDAFDSITYQKGGGVLAMAESYLGEDAFREGVRTHMRRFPHGVATSRDFFESLAQGAGRPEIVAALESFTDRSHVPMVETRLDCPTDGAAPRVRLSQSTFKPTGTSLEDRTWTIPVCVSAYGLTGAPAKTCTILKDAQGEVALTGVCPAFVSPNANGAGYYRASLDERGWTALLAGFGRLPPGEQIAALDSLYAGFSAGRTAAALVMRGVEAGAAVSDFSVRRKAASVAEELGWVPATPAAREAYARWVRAAFARSVVETTARSSPAERQAAQAVTRLLALNGRDPAVRARLLSGARAALGMARGPAVSGDLRATAFIVGVQDGGPAFFARLLETAKSTTDAQLQSEALAALSHAPRAEDRTAFIDAVLAPPFNGSQMRRAFGRSQDFPESAPTGLAVLTTRFDALAARLPTGLAGQTAPAFAKALCSAQDKAALEAVFRENASKVAGYERSLTQATEQIARCAALREAKGPEFAAALNVTD